MQVFGLIAQMRFYCNRKFKHDCHKHGIKDQLSFEVKCSLVHPDLVPLTNHHNWLDLIYGMSNWNLVECRQWKFHRLNGVHSMFIEAIKRVGFKLYLCSNMVKFNVWKKKKMCSRWLKITFHFSCECTWRIRNGNLISKTSSFKVILFYESL